MARASSGRKVARAAGTGGGRTSGGRTPWLYVVLIAVIVVLGVAGTISSRQTRSNQINHNGTTAAPTVGSTETAAFAVYICGTLQPNINPTKNPTGITTKNDGLIHIQPNKNSAAGKNATLALFTESIGMKLTGSQLQMPGGKLYSDGDSCNGQRGHVYIRRFTSSTDTTGVLERSDPGTIHLENGTMYTAAFVPSSQKDSIPPPAPDVRTALGKAVQAQQQAAQGNPGAAPPTPGTTAPATTAPATPAPATTAPAPTAPATTAPATSPTTARP